MTKNAKEIISKIKADSKLQEELKKCKNIEEAIKVLNNNNLRCSIDDFKGVDSTNKKVSIKELKKVSGGGSCACVLVGEGYYVKSKEEFNCQCYFLGAGGGVCSCGCFMGGGGTY